MSAARRPFFLVFLLIVLVIAGGVSYAASGSPDGLDSATLQGCQGRLGGHRLRPCKARRT